LVESAGFVDQSGKLLPDFQLSQDAEKAFDLQSSSFLNQTHFPEFEKVNEQLHPLQIMRLNIDIAQVHVWGLEKPARDLLVFAVQVMERLLHVEHGRFVAALVFIFDVCLLNEVMTRFERASQMNCRQILSLRE